MFPFGRSRGHAAAAVVAPVLPGPFQFPNTNIHIVASNMYPGNYQSDVANHLININTHFPELLNKLTQTGKRVGISYQAPTANQINGNTDGSYLIRDVHWLALGGHRTHVQFGQALQTELTANNVTVPNLATALPLVQLPSWNGGNSPNPFQGMSNANLINRINDWIAGNVFPTHPEMDVLVMPACLPTPTHGPGCNVAVKYDPRHNAGRPAIVGLFHELVHAYYLTRGTNPGIVESSVEDAGGRHFELMAVGMPPYQNKRFSENKFRLVMNVGVRNVYP
jgi:hypothetical protein